MPAPSKAQHTLFAQLSCNNSSSNVLSNLVESNQVAISNFKQLHATFRGNFSLCRQPLNGIIILNPCLFPCPCCAKIEMASFKKKRLACVALIALILRCRRRKRRNRILWTREWTRNQEYQGTFHQLLQELRVLDVSSYRNFVRMDAASFEELLLAVAPRIVCQDTVMREAIPPAERLAVTLRFLATGEPSSCLEEFITCTNSYFELNR